MTFEEKMMRLKEICSRLSESGITLEETARLYKEGMKLSDECLSAISEMKSEFCGDKNDNV